MCHFCYFPSSWLNKCSRPGVLPRYSLLLNTPIPEGLSKAAPSPPCPASVLCQHQWPLQSSCCSRGSGLDHSMFTTAIARLQSQSQWGPVPRFHKLTAITCRPLSQPTWGPTLPNSMPAAITAQPQQENTHSPHWGNTWSPGSETRGLCHQAPRDNIYVRLLFKGWETYLICLIHRNKHNELSKMRRQKQYLPNKRNKTKVSEKELNEMEI